MALQLCMRTSQFWGILNEIHNGLVFNLIIIWPGKAEIDASGNIGKQETSYKIITNGSLIELIISDD